MHKNDCVPNKLHKLKNNYETPLLIQPL